MTPGDMCYRAQRAADVPPRERTPGSEDGSIAHLIGHLTVGYDLLLAELLRGPDPLAAIREHGFLDTAAAIAQLAGDLESAELSRHPG